jgi:hypothetical protein
MSVNTDQKIIKNKVSLLNLADMPGSVSEACKVMGYSRDSLPVQGAVRQGRRVGLEGDQPAQAMSEEPARAAD